jgi:hypothetical protein
MVRQFEKIIKIFQFSLIGGNEQNHGIYVETVDKLSKASDAGLKRGDQVINFLKI